MNTVTLEKVGLLDAFLVMYVEIGVALALSPMGHSMGLI